MVGWTHSIADVGEEELSRPNMRSDCLVGLLPPAANRVDSLAGFALLISGQYALRASSSSPCRFDVRVFAQASRGCPALSGPRRRILGG